MDKPKQYCCQQCYKYWSQNSPEIQKEINFPIFFWDFSGYELCGNCNDKYNYDLFIDAEKIENKTENKNEKTMEIEIDALKYYSRKIYSVPKEGDLINICLELELSLNNNLVDNFEYNLIRSVELLFGGTSWDKIYYQNIYYHDKNKEKIIFKDKNRIKINLPFDISKNNPLYCNNFDDNTDIKLYFDFGVFGKIILYDKCKLILTYLTPGYKSKCHNLEYSKYTQTQIQTDGEQQLQMFPNGPNYNITHCNSFTLNFNHPVTEINIGVYNKSNNFLEYLDCFDDFRMICNGIDMSYNVIKAESILKNGNIYTIKFDCPINMSIINNIKLNFKFIKEKIDKYDKYKYNKENLDLGVFIDAKSINELLYHNNETHELKYYGRYGMDYKVNFFNKIKVVENVNIFDDCENIML